MTAGSWSCWFSTGPWQQCERVLNKWPSYTWSSWQHGNPPTTHWVRFVFCWNAAVRNSSMNRIHWAIRRCMHYSYAMPWKRRVTDSRSGINGTFCIWYDSCCRTVQGRVSIRREIVRWHVCSGMCVIGKCVTNCWICWYEKKATRTL